MLVLSRLSARNVLLLFTLLFPVPLLAVGASPASAADKLTLRVDDAKAAPGEQVAVEVRTYAPRGVGQGQICLRASSNLDGTGSGSSAPAPQAVTLAPVAEEVRLRNRSGASGGDAVRTGGIASGSSWSEPAPEHPFVALEGVTVLSALGDAVFSQWFDEGTQIAVVDFASPSATINEADGPLAIFYFRLDPDLKEDQEFELVLDPGVTFIVDDSGEQVPLRLRSGRLRIEEARD